MSSSSVAVASPKAVAVAAPEGIPPMQALPAQLTIGEMQAAAAAAHATAKAVAAATIEQLEPSERYSSPPVEKLLSDLQLKDTAHTAVVYRVVLTGGPCGGKTTALSTLTERFQALGWRVFRVPEAATVLISGGHSFANTTPLQQYQFQATLLRLMLNLEESFISLARSTHQKCIVLCDRGTMVSTQAAHVSQHAQAAAFKIVACMTITAITHTCCVGTASVVRCV